MKKIYSKPVCTCCQMDVEALAVKAYGSGGENLLEDGGAWSKDEDYDENTPGEADVRPHKPGVFEW